jgi:hypothetical protein
MVTTIGPIGFIAVELDLALRVLAVSILLLRRSSTASAAT